VGGLGSDPEREQTRGKGRRSRDHFWKWARKRGILRGKGMTSAQSCHKLKNRGLTGWRGLSRSLDLKLRLLTVYGRGPDLSSKRQVQSLLFFDSRKKIV